MGVSVTITLPTLLDVTPVRAIFGILVGPAPSTETFIVLRTGKLSQAKYMAFYVI